MRDKYNSCTTTANNKFSSSIGANETLVMLIKEYTFLQSGIYIIHMYEYIYIIYTHIHTVHIYVT